MNAEYKEAVFEVLRHENDELLGRWRWPENPNYVVYPYTFDPPRDGVRGVTVLAEDEPRVLTAWEDNLDEIYGRSNYEDVRRAAREAARAYFDAHPVPEPKSWWTAKTGEVWVITVDSEESAWTVNNDGKFENPDSTYEPTNPNITHARRIWPQGSYEAQNAFIAESSAAYPDVDPEEAARLTEEARHQRLIPNDPKPWVTPGGYRYAEFNEGEAMFGGIAYRPRPEYDSSEETKGP